MSDLDLEARRQLIDHLDEQQRSLLLVRLAFDWKRPSEDGRCDVCGWPVFETVEEGCTASSCSLRPVPKERADQPPNLYDPMNADLLFRVMRWFAGASNWKPHIGKWAKWMEYAKVYMNMLNLHDWLYGCADYGLALAIEVGMISEDDVEAKSG